MKKVLFALMAVATLASVSHALTVVDFEGLPDANYYFGGNTNLGGYYAGLNFGADATILDQAIYGYNSGGYPPHSGDAVLFSVSDPVIRVDFSSATNHAELWYTTATDLWLEAYDSGNNLLTSSTAGGSNYGSNSFLDVNWGSNSIAYVLIHDTGDFFTVDDFGWEDTGGHPVPEPTTVLLMASGLLGMGGISRFRRKS